MFLWKHKLYVDIFRPITVYLPPGAKLDVLVEHPTLSAKHGDKVQLKVILQNLPTPLVLKNLMVQWFFRGTQVAEFDDKITSKKGLSMSLDAIGKGDVTLTIDSFSPDDAGNYRCYVYYNSDTTMKQIVLSGKWTSDRYWVGGVAV